LPKSVFVSKTAQQTINVHLQPSAQILNEVRIGPKGYINPAWAIIREIIRHKPENDPRSLPSYQYESYSRIELDASNLSAKLLKKKFIQKALSIADSMKMEGVDHMPVLPLFLSENRFRFFFIKVTPKPSVRILKRQRPMVLVLKTVPCLRS